ncbi:MAG: PssD/Cps14F family polysaccharide biosynthesis glycosyltransferase [Candidatus Hydrothermarchaeota archaeon]|jgi:UDP-N-acetylglucosamine:LPS N-acetylglucosamine transferase|nr:PssD/Cps14F family polysaccharide biosynthesis glycosyltransferase [Candidatus Hydrothermarchaeota archaeon]
MRKLKLCLACSAGGHLTELMRLEEAFQGYPCFIATFRREDTEKLNERVYYLIDPKRNPLKLLVNFLQSLRVVLRERPMVVITTGAGIVVPLCIIAKLLGAKIIYIESFARITSKSLSGVLLYPIADLFFVQWRQLLEKYGSKARYGGKVV